MCIAHREWNNLPHPITNETEIENVQKVKAEHIERSDMVGVCVLWSPAKVGAPPL